LNISIITVVYNDKHGLLKTIDSVNYFANNTCHTVEYIVIDGGSTDGTQLMFDLIKSDCFSKIVTVSESDSGIYDAMNKGVGYISNSSEYCLFMNAGDIFLASASNIINNHKFASKIEVFGITSFLNGNEIKVRRINNKSCIESWPAYPHQSTFIDSNLQRNTPYNLSFKILADYDFFSKLYTSGASVSVNGDVISIFSQGGASNRFDTFVNTVKELACIQKKYFKRINYELAFWLFCKLLIRLIPCSGKLEYIARVIKFGEKK
jgi:putative colanic acid biosynthesis glycosyltransferase